MFFAWRFTVPGWLFLVAAVSPASAQVDRTGGGVEFRSPDRPISAPALRFPESTGLSSDSATRMSAFPTPEDVLKKIDSDLVRSGSRSEPSSTPSVDKRDDRFDQRATSTLK